MKCPKCGLINPPTALVCDCGYDFVQEGQGRPPDWSDVGSPGGSRPDARRGAALLAAGLACIALALLGALPTLGVLLTQLLADQASRPPWWLHLWPLLPCSLVAGTVLCIMAAKQ